LVEKTVVRSRAHAIIKQVELFSHCKLIEEKKNGCVMFSIPTVQILFFPKKWQKRNVARRQRRPRNARVQGAADIKKLSDESRRAF